MWFPGNSLPLPSPDEPPHFGIILVNIRQRAFSAIICNGEMTTVRISPERAERNYLTSQEGTRARARPSLVHTGLPAPQSLAGYGQTRPKKMSTFKYNC